MLKRLVVAAGLIALLSCAGARAVERVDSIVKRDRLRCGIDTGYPGFAARDAKGEYVGFEIDICRAIAASLLGSGQKVEFIEVASLRDFRAGDIDVVSRRLSWSLVREQRAIRFGPVIFYDGQMFLVPRGSDVRAVQQLSGRRICVRHGGFETRVASYLQKNRLEVNVKIFETEERVEAAFYAGLCDAWSGDLTELAAARARREPHGQRSRLLPEIISREPLALMLRQDDARLLSVVQWTVYLLIQAEEQGIDRSNLEELWRAGLLERRLDILAGAQPAVGFSADWAYQVLRAVGNYGDIFARNLGPGTAVDIDRGLNRLWTEDGLLYAPVMR